MNVILYKTNDLRMVKRLTNGKDISRLVKGDVNKNNPNIMVECDDVMDYNYMSITDGDFRAYYFINPTKMNARFTLISGTKDVLHTHAVQIYECEAIASRNENESNLYLNDDSIASYANSMIVFKNFPNSIDNNKTYLVAAG